MLVQCETNQNMCPDGESCSPRDYSHVHHVSCVVSKVWKRCVWIYTRSRWMRFICANQIFQQTAELSRSFHLVAEIFVPNERMCSDYAQGETNDVLPECVDDIPTKHRSKQVDICKSLIKYRFFIICLHLFDQQRDADGLSLL